MTITQKMEYVIRYDGIKQKSYFKGWTSPAAIPMFGAKLHESPRYSTEDAARTEINKMPTTASLMCEIKPVKARKAKKEKR